MNIPRYSTNQIETIAEDLLKQYDPERLYKIKSLDVYDVIEKCLDVSYHWANITPDHSILGLTAFKSCWLYVLVKPQNELERVCCYKNLIEKGLTFEELKLLNGLVPKRIYLKKGMILIDESLTKDSNRGRENFTVMHEVGHQILHKDYFRKNSFNYINECTNIYNQYGKKILKTPSDYIEHQANAFAAAFLMPRELTVKTFNSLYSGKNKLNVTNKESKKIIKQMAKEFSVSLAAMKYRLINLGLIFRE